MLTAAALALILGACLLIAGATSLARRRDVLRPRRARRRAGQRDRVRLLAGHPNPAPNLRDPVVTDSTMRLMHRQAAATAPAFVPREFIEDIRGHETLQLWETRLAAGREVYLLGTPARAAGSLALRPTSSGFTVFTPDARQTVIDRRREQAASSRSLAVGLSCAGVVVTALSSAVLYVVT